MTKSTAVLAVTIIFWLVIGGLVIRTNRLWFSPVTFRWVNLHQPSATFRWVTAPAKKRAVILPPNTTRSFKVQIPRKFRSGTLSIITAPGSGVIVASINAPAGQTNTTASIVGAGTTRLSFSWETIALQTRTFNVDIMTSDQAATISNITLTLSL